MKGICKGFNKYISQIFVVKEREMEIGYPTDVKHVAHIGLDGPDGTPPSWMSEYKNGPEFSVASMGSMGGSTRDPTWSSQEFEQSLMWQPSAGPTLSNFPPANLPCIPKKPRRKKTKSSSSSSPRSGSSRGSRSSKSKSVNL